MFEGEAAAYPSEAPYRCSSLGQAPVPALKLKTTVERLVRGKHSSLLQTYVCYRRENFITLDPGFNANKTFFLFYDCLSAQKASVFVPGKPFQLSILCVSKAEVHESRVNLG